MEKIDRTPNALLPNLIMNLNALDGNFFKSIRARLYINKFKKNQSAQRIGPLCYDT